MTQTFAILGDSQAGGVSAALQRELAAKGYQLQAGGKVTRNGGSTAVLLSQNLVTRVPPADLVFVALGGNDAYHPESFFGSSYEAELERVIGTLSPKSSRIIWMGPPSSTSSSADAKRRLVTEAQRRYLGSRITWLDGRALAEGLPRNDEVHLTPSGYSTLAGRLAARIPSAVGSTSRFPYNGSLAADAASTGSTLLIAAAVVGGSWWLANQFAGAPRRGGRR